MMSHSKEYWAGIMSLCISKQSILIVVGLLLSLYISSYVLASERSIEVFTTAGKPVVNVPDGVPVIELDAPARLDAELSQGLPDDIDEARAEMQSRLQSPQWQRKLQQYGDLYTGVARAWMLRVEKVPAVVVDSRYVIYGETDVAAAVDQANGYIEREGIQ